MLHNNRTVSITVSPSATLLFEFIWLIHSLVRHHSRVSFEKNIQYQLSNITNCHLMSTETNILVHLLLALQKTFSFIQAWVELWEKICFRDSFAQIFTQKTFSFINHACRACVQLSITKFQHEDVWRKKTDWGAKTERGCQWEKS